MALLGKSREEAEPVRKVIKQRFRWDLGHDIWTMGKIGYAGRLIVFPLRAQPEKS